MHLASSLTFEKVTCRFVGCLILTDFPRIGKRDFPRVGKHLHDFKMTYVNERGVISSGPSWQLSRLPDMVWGFFNVVYLFFRSLLEPALNIGSQSSSGSRSGNGRGPPRPPRGGFGSMSNIDSPGNFPPMGG